MFNIKNQIKSNNGFTLIEMMVVVTIMVILATAMVINLAGQRAGRDIAIAQNQLVSNIRQAQSYILSSRVLPNGQSVQFYVLKFDLSKPTQYTLETIYNVSTGPLLQDIQTVNLPPNIQIANISSSSYPIAIDRSLALDAVNQYSAPNQYLQTPNCALVAFSAPFGKVIFNGGCTPASPGNMPYTIQASDDYEKIVNFQNNVSCASWSGTGTPAACSASTDSLLTITLSDSGKTVYKTVTVNAITGAIVFN